MTRQLWTAALAGLAIVVWPGRASGAQRLARIRPLRRRSSPTGRGREPSPGANPWGRSRRQLPSQVGVAGLRVRWIQRERKGAADRDLLGFLEGLSSALRAGLPPARAFEVVVASMETEGDHEEARAAIPGAASTGRGDHEQRRWIQRDGQQSGDLYRLARRLAAHSATGAPLVPVWSQAARDRASPALAAIAAAWAMTERHGAPLVDVLDSVVGALREGARAEAAAETALAAPRATAALLAALPFGGVALGELVGVHPLSTLVGTQAGRLAAGVGLACTIGGRVWMSRLVARAIPP